MDLRVHKCYLGLFQYFGSILMEIYSKTDELSESLISLNQIPSAVMICLSITLWCI